MRRTKSRYLLLYIQLFCITVVAQAPAGVPVTITLSDPSGARVPHAKVRIIPATDDKSKTETDDKGALSLLLHPGGYALFAQAQGFKSIATHIDIRESTDPQMFSAVFQMGEVGSPIVSPASSKDDLAVFAYPYHEPTAFSAQQLKAMPHISITIHNSHTDREETYSGVRLSQILAKLGAPLGNELRREALGNYIIAAGSDGYSALLSLAEIDPEFHPGEVIVADSMDGQPLDARSGPLKLVVSEDKRPARSVRNLTTIELKAVR